MIWYRPRYLSLVIRTLNIVVSLGASVFLLLMAVSQELSTPMISFLLATTGFLTLLGYYFAVPVFAWPIAISIDTSTKTLTLRYSFFRSRTVPVARIAKCSVTEVRSRYLFATYVLDLIDRRKVILSDLNIRNFPGRFAYDIDVDVTEQVPVFIPGFRCMFNRNK